MSKSVEPHPHISDKGRTDGGEGEEEQGETSWAELRFEGSIVRWALKA